MGRITLQQAALWCGGTINEKYKDVKRINFISFRDWYKLANSINEAKLKDDYAVPWYEIDVGIKESFLKNEYEKVNEILR